MLAIHFGFMKGHTLSSITPSNKTLEIYMVDTFGDGWNGNYIHLTSSDGNTFPYITN